MVSCLFRSIIGLVCLLSVSALASDVTFVEAKKLLKKSVYFDQNKAGTFYCGCQWRWMGASGGRIDLASCGFEARKNQARAERLEWEHIVPAHHFGKARRCWQQGGRENCVKNDPVFGVMEGDMHNLVPSVGEVNGDRSNFQFSQFTPTTAQYGRCEMAVDFKNKQASPPVRSRGQIARVYFYMHDRYNLSMSRQQAQLMMAWDKQYPVDAREKRIHDRIAAITHVENDFVTGKRQWSLNHKNQGAGVKAVSTSVNEKKPSALINKATTSSGGTIRGNKNSQLYHLPEGCPGYSQMSDKNLVLFPSEKAAQAAGFKKAGNCR
jgi:deoxyribonuclease-1